MEFLLTEILSHKEGIAIRVCYSSTSDHACAAMSSQILNKVYKNIDKGELYNFMILDAKCLEHSQPCRKCAAKMTLY